MEANQSQNKIVQFIKTNRSYVIAALVIVVLGVYFSVRGNEAGQNEETSPPPAQSQNSGDTVSVGEPSEPPPSEAPQSGNEQQNSGDSAANGSVQASGTLRSSDNAAKGNYMIESNRGKIYLNSKHDYAALRGKQVTLTATGSLNSFSGAKLAEAAGATVVAKTSSASTQKQQPAAGVVRITGKLKSSDNAAKGNYVVESAEGKIYLNTKQNYSAWVDQQVTLTANGTINSFSGAFLTK